MWLYLPFVGCGVGHHILKGFAASGPVLVLGRGRQAQVGAVLQGLGQLGRGISADRVVPRGFLDIDRCHVSGLLVHIE